MILGFSGTRLGPLRVQSEAIRRFVRGMPVTRFVHGGAYGSDTIAHNIVRQLHPDIIIEIHPGSSPGITVTLPAGRCEIYPALPSLDRNRVIAARIHGLLAVPQADKEELQSGTWATVRYARALGCPVYLIRADGRIVRDLWTSTKGKANDR